MKVNGDVQPIFQNVKVLIACTKKIFDVGRDLNFFLHLCPGNDLRNRLGLILFACFSTQRTAVPKGRVARRSRPGKPVAGAMSMSVFTTGMLLMGVSYRVA